MNRYLFIIKYTVKVKHYLTRRITAIIRVLNEILYLPVIIMAVIKFQE